jgi:hypothetical protein
MAIFLDENQFGNDPACIGFPHVLLCMALVAMTNNDLYGIHLDWPGAVADQGLGELARLMNTNGVQARDMVALYGCCNRSTRYPGVTNTGGAWQAEMTHNAGLLNYHGNVLGFDTSIINPQQGTYVEYYPNYPAGTCFVYYKRNEKMQYTQGTNPNLRKFHTYKRIFVSLQPGTATTAAAIIPTYWNKGQLHEVDYALRMSNFLV